MVCGMPRSRPALLRIPCIEIRSMYSTINGPTPLPTILGTATVTWSSVENGASSVVAWSGRGYSLSVASVARASVPSEPMISCVRS